MTRTSADLYYARATNSMNRSETHLRQSYQQGLSLRDLHKRSDMTTWSNISSSGVLPYCGVCKSDFSNNDIVRLITSCHHAMHASCSDTWLSDQTICPSCGLSLCGSSSTCSTPLPFTASPSVCSSQHLGTVSEALASIRNQISNLSTAVENISTFVESLMNRSESVSPITWDQPPRSTPTVPSPPTSTSVGRASAPLMLAGYSTKEPWIFESPRRRSASPGSVNKWKPGSADSFPSNW